MMTHPTRWRGRCLAKRHTSTSVPCQQIQVLLSSSPTGARAAGGLPVGFDFCISCFAFNLNLWILIKSIQNTSYYCIVGVLVALPTTIPTTTPLTPPLCHPACHPPRTIHWGSAVLPPAPGTRPAPLPRVSISWGCADDAFEPPYFSRRHLPCPPLALRLGLLGAQMITYHERFPATPRCAAQGWERVW